MILNYEIANTKYSTDKSNSDVEITYLKNDSNTIFSIKALKNIKLNNAIIEKEVNFSNNAKIFFNGYQSWTDTKEFYKNEKEKNILKGALRRKVVRSFGLDRYGDSSFYSYKKSKLHGYDLFYVKDNTESFIYNLNYEDAYLIFEYIKPNKLNLISDVNGKVLSQGEEFIVFSFKEFDSIKDGEKEFKEDFSVSNKPILGYTSWYNTYQNINEELILKNLNSIDKRFNLFQIDDGFETRVGDWLSIDKNKFPNGLKPIVDKIHSKGLLAGIWLAPFAGEEESELFKTHKEWFLKDENGSFIKAGCNWNGFYALDLTKEEVKEYVKKCLNYYKDLGFDFFKLDFVYSASINVPNGYTRASWQYYTYRFLREILENKLILGCGANLFSSYKNFDFLRIGCDVSFDFDDKPYMRLLHRERNSTKNTIQNTIYRSVFDNRLFLNDSDVFILRDDNTTLSFETRKALIRINALFSSVLMTSDDIAFYDDEKNKILEEALSTFYNKPSISFARNHNLIDITLEKNGKIEHISYDTRKGIIYDR